MLRPQNKKVSKQFIAYLKKTPELPLKREPQTKKNQPLISQKQKNINNQNQTVTIKEGDISRISCSYVLENDRLRKKSVHYKKPQHNQDYPQSDEQVQFQEHIETLKQFTKLQFLEKKGFLKADEKKRLQLLRERGYSTINTNKNTNSDIKSNCFESKQRYSNKQIPPNLYHPQKFIDYQNQNPNDQAQQYYEQYYPENYNHDNYGTEMNQPIMKEKRTAVSGSSRNTPTFMPQATLLHSQPHSGPLYHHTSSHFSFGPLGPQMTNHF